MIYRSARAVSPFARFAASTTVSQTAQAKSKSHFKVSGFIRTSGPRRSRGSLAAGGDRVEGVRHADGESQSSWSRVA